MAKIGIFKSLRGRLIIFSLIIVSIPILVAGFAMKQSAEQALIDEKAKKLETITYLLDKRLGPEGYDGILRSKFAMEASRDEKIRTVNRSLAEITDEIALSSPGLGAGFYSKDLDAIVTYGPADQYGHTVGWSIQNDHPGRQVMNDNQFQVRFGTLVRGNIMNAMRPLVREGRVIGYIFVNELTDDIQAQLQAMDKSLMFSIIIGILLSLMLILLLTQSTWKDVQVVIHGLQELRFDLRKPITGVKGEMGEVAETINEMARALGEARTLSENIMASMADGIIAVDTTGKITAFNQAAEKMTGFTVLEVIGKYYEDIFCHDAGFNSRLIETLHTGKPYIGNRLEYPIMHGKLSISVSTSMLKNIHGNVLGAVVVFKDLTERKQLEEQVKRADRLATLGELMAGVAHEIRNPLTSIKGFLQFFQSAGNDEERNKYLPILLKEVDRMNRIIETLLYFSRTCQASVSPTDLSGVLRDTLILVQSRAKNHGIVFDVQIDEKMPLVNFDGEQFQQVFLNLLLNSLQALEDEGQIRVVARYLEASEEVEIVFTDTGPGIPAELREKVFDPFFTTKQAGTGLGLAVVQRIVNAQGGSIHIGDNPEGGALIRIVIPRLLEQEAIS